MSFTGVGVIGSHVAYEAPAPDDTGMVAARDIVRANPLGQNVVVVPAGQPIPAGVDVGADDAIPSLRREVPNVEYHHRPEPYLTGPERQNLFSERALSLLRREASHRGAE